jgi:hypothetical protein
VAIFIQNTYKSYCSVILKKKKNKKMHKTKYGKTTRARPPGVKCDPRGGKSKFLEKRLSPKAKNH